MRKKNARRGPRRPSPAWREFEQLVARIESSLSAEGAVVKSPDRVKSLLSGKRREVDASIRAKVGSVNLLITVECRKRRPKQDVVWIEQLAKKRDVLGAAHTIAVSSAGFTTEAQITAEKSGIHLRQLSEVSPEEIANWLKPESLVHLFNHADNVKIEAYFYGDADDTESTEVRPDLAEAFRQDNVNARIFTVSELGGQVLSVNELWLHAQAQRDLFAGVPLDGTSVTRTIGLRFAKGKLGLMTTSGYRSVAELRLTAELSIKREEIPLAEATLVKYTSPEDQEIQRVEFTTSGASITNIRLGLQAPAGSNAVTLSIDFLRAEPNVS